MRALFRLQIGKPAVCRFLESLVAKLVDQATTQSRPSSPARQGPGGSSLPWPATAPAGPAHCAELGIADAEPVVGVPVASSAAAWDADAAGQGAGVSTAVTGRNSTPGSLAGHKVRSVCSAA